MKFFPVLVLVGLAGVSAAQVRIHELMASNTRSYPDITDFEDYPDWIELKNSGGTPASLEGYFLSDDPSDPFKWPVPAGATVPANGFLLIMADGHDTGPGRSFPRGYWPWKNFTTEKFHTNFSLSADGESVLLTQATGLNTVSLVNASTPAPVAPATVAVWKYLDNGSDQSTQWRARIFDDSAWASGPAELGYTDNPATTVSFGPSSTNKYLTTYFRHSFSVPDPKVYHGLNLKLLVDDGCVVYLNGAEIARLNMPAGEPTWRTRATYSVGSGGSAEENVFHPFSVPVSALLAGTNVLAVEVHQAAANSVDLSFDLGLEATSHTAAATLDSITYPAQVTDVSYGRDAVDPAIWKAFAEATPGADNTTAAVDDVRLDGTPVTASLPGGCYATDQSVTLTSASGQIRYTLDGSNPRSTSPLYSAPLDITATTVVRARCFEAGRPPGPILTRTYFRGETIGGVPYVSVVADPGTLFGNTIGIYTNQHETVSGSYGLRDVYKGKDAPGHVEFFASGGAAGFRANCGIRIGGENNWVHPQKALNLAIKGKWGDDEIKYDVFPGSRLPIHNALTLRDGGDNWNKDMLRDCLFPKLCDGRMAVDTADYRPSVVFINGAYWGLHDVRQRWDATWYAQKYHVAADAVDHLLYGHITSSSVTLGVDGGTADDWLELMAFLNTADLTVAANWAFVESKVNLDSFMDFVIAESYGNNTSWQHNREFWKEKKPGAKWKWFLTDMDRTFSTSKLTGILSEFLGNEDVLVRLKTNVGFRQRLAQRYAAHMAGTFAATRVQAVVSQMAAEVDAEVPRHVARWAPNGTTEAIRTSHLQQIINYATLRAANFSAEVATQLGVPAAVDFTLNVNHAAQGSVLVQGVAVPAGTFKMFPAIPFSLVAVPAPGFAFSHWTGAAGGAAVDVTLAGAQSITAHFIPSGETVLGGTLTGDTVLTAAASPYVLESDLIVPPGTTLTISSGVTLRLTEAVNVRVQGRLAIHGTAGQPVTFQGRSGARWGGISFENPDGPATLSHVVLRGATRGFDPTKYPYAISGLNATLVLDFIDIAESEGPIFTRGGSLTVRDSSLYNPHTGDCINVKQGQAITQRCVFPGNNAPDTDAIDYDGVVNGLIENCRIHRFQGSNSDGIDVGESCVNVLIQGNLIYFNSDKGVSVGQGSSVTMRRNLIVGCVLGVGIKDTGSTVWIDQNTFASCGTGVAIYEKNFGDGGGTAVITNNIFSKAATPPVTVDGFSSFTASWNLSDTLPVPGSDNLVSDPWFVDPVVLNYQLQPGSPAINGGDPAHAPDADGSIVDLGAQYLHQAGDYPYTIGETIVVNELLANSGGASDWIELHNRTGEAVNVGGWFLSDSAAIPAKYRIPPGTVIAPRGFLTFYEDTHFGAASVDPNKIVSFALSDTGETVYLTSAVNDEITDYQSKEEFGPSVEGETLGTTYKPSSDSWNFVGMQSATPGGRNAGPRVGPVVISEIMYHPAGNGDAEYVELLNVGSAPVKLFDDLKNKAWRISDGIDFEFPAGLDALTMQPGQRVVLTRSQGQFNALFGSLVPPNTKVFEWTTGGLSNSGETLQLDRPGPVDALNVVQYVRVDRVNYGDGIPWPETPDGGGASLTKISEKDYGNDEFNWLGAPASPGSIAPGERFADWAALHGVGGPAADPDGDGLSNLLEYAFGLVPGRPDTLQVPSLSIGPGSNAASFQIQTARTDLDYQLEVSADLGAWQRVETAPVGVGPGVQTRAWQDTGGDRPRRFFRVVVTPKP